MSKHDTLVGTAALSSSSLSPTPINSLLYADDVALVGSASEVRHMLDLAQIHSLTLGYKWSPPKCAVLNAPSPSSSRYVPMSLYDQDLPTVEEFTYLGVPFDVPWRLWLNFTLWVLTVKALLCFSLLVSLLPSSVLSSSMA
ncbi:hypothetical protein G6F27_014068 [Rhizopus arrhizus]|nr:hypothetical protein G6F27_014068 [Rhizopus arrhizus]